MSLTAVVKISIGVSQWSLPGRALFHCQAPPAALSRREQTPLLFLFPHLQVPAYLSLNRDHRFTGAPKLTRSIIRVMIILIRWGAALQGERCAINYTLAFWVNWLSDRVHFSLSSWMLVFFSRVVIQSPWRNPKTQNGSVSCGTLWRHLIGVIMVKGGGMEICIWCLEEIVHVLQWRATVFFFWKGIIAQCELLQREKKPWHYQP